jgi:hypothetical protein
MQINSELRKALVEKVQCYQERVPVFRIAPQLLPHLEKQAADMGRRFAASFDLKEARVSLQRREGRTIFLLPENARLRLFHASGVVSAERGWSPFQHILSPDAQKVDKESLIAQGQEAVSRLGLDRPRENEELRFERLWQLKATGMTREGKPGTVVLTRAVVAFRRYLAGLPIWGRASVFTKLASQAQLDAFGLDWRPVQQEPFDTAHVLDPADGANKVLEALQTYLPGGTFTQEDYYPQLFALGYFSQPKRRPQSVMQPVWVAMFRARGWNTLSRLIVVPAVSTPYEPICRVPEPPPLDAVKSFSRGPKQISEHCLSGPEKKIVQAHIPYRKTPESS